MSKTTSTNQGAREVYGDIGINGPIALQARISTDNSSTATLAGDAVFTGIGEDVSGFAVVKIFYKSAKFS